MNNEEFDIACDCIDIFDLYLTLFENISISKEKLCTYKIYNNDDYRKMLYELLDFLNAVYTFKEFLANEKHYICKVIHETYYNYENDKGNNYRFLLEYRNILIHDHLIPRFYTQDGNVVLDTNELRKYILSKKQKKHLDFLIKKIYKKSKTKIGDDYILLYEIVSDAFEEICSMFYEIAYHLYDSSIEDALEVYIQNNENTNDLYNVCSYIIKFFGTDSPIGLNIVRLLKDKGIS